MPIELNPDWSEFLRALISRRVRFLLIGGHAVAAHGEPRVTEDLDVFVAPSLANARRLRAALVDFGFGSVAPAAEELARPERVFMLGRSPGVSTSSPASPAYRRDALLARQGGDVGPIQRLGLGEARGHPEDPLDHASSMDVPPARAKRAGGGRQGAPGRDGARVPPGKRAGAWRGLGGGTRVAPRAGRR